jgi:multidrug efflux system membrane fusion protein
MRDNSQESGLGGTSVSDTATKSTEAGPPISANEVAPPVMSAEPKRRRRGVLSRVAGYAVALAVMGGLAYLVVAQMPARQGNTNGPGAGRFGPGGRFGRDRAVPVLVATAKSADVPVYFDGVGTARALNIVTVRSQVDGKLLKLNFREGEDVERGAVLAEIDPTIYQAALDQAVAKKAQDEAQLANARIDLDRYTRLAQSNAATKQQADTQRALVAQLEALVKADQAQIDNARAYLDYTKIVAPISGRTGIRLVDVGNLVRSSETSGIVVITQLRPISAIFTLPQQELPAVNKAFAQGPLTALALASDNRTVADRGVLQVIDNQVDQTTGTVRLRAQFPNKDLALWPGQFVNVKLLVDTLHNVVVVPTAAVQRGPNGTFAYVVRKSEAGKASSSEKGSAGGKGGAIVTVRPVTVNQQDDLQAVIASGLQAGERVVTSGFAQLTDGSRVVISREEGFAPRGRGGERNGGGPQSESPAAPQSTARRSGAQAEPSTTLAPTTGATPPATVLQRERPVERSARDSEPRRRRGDAGRRPPR